MILEKTAEEILAVHNSEKVASGLVEQKFFLRGVAEATLEEVYQDVNGLDAAFLRGDFIELVHTIPQ